MPGLIHKNTYIFLSVENRSFVICVWFTTNSTLVRVDSNPLLDEQHADRVVWIQQRLGGNYYVIESLEWVWGYDIVSLDGSVETSFD